MCGVSPRTSGRSPRAPSPAPVDEATELPRLRPFACGNRLGNPRTSARYGTDSRPGATPLPAGDSPGPKLRQTEAGPATRAACRLSGRCLVSAAATRSGCTGEAPAARSRHDSFASSFETEPAMMTSSPSFQFAAESTPCGSRSAAASRSRAGPRRSYGRSSSGRRG